MINIYLPHLYQHRLTGYHLLNAKSFNNIHLGWWLRYDSFKKKPIQEPSMASLFKMAQNTEIWKFPDDLYSVAAAIFEGGEGYWTKFWSGITHGPSLTNWVQIRPAVSVDKLEVWKVNRWKIINDRTRWWQKFPQALCPSELRSILINLEMYLEWTF